MIRRISVVLGRMMGGRGMGIVGLLASGLGRWLCQDWLLYIYMITGVFEFRNIDLELSKSRDIISKPPIDLWKAHLHSTSASASAFPSPSQPFQ